MMRFFRYLPLFLICAAFSLPALAETDYGEREEVLSWITDFSNREKLNPEYLSYYLQKAQKRDNILSLMDAPVKTPPGWYEYAPRFLNEARISGGTVFRVINEPHLDRATRFFGVPQEIIVAIIGVETHYGRNVGKFPVLDALATLGFDYPRRADYFLAELEHFFLLVIDNQFELTQLKGSYAGAMGIAQFMPRSYRHYAVDFDGDGKIDLWQAPDAIGSIGFYLLEHGWQKNGRLLSDAVVPEEVEESVLPLLDGGLSETKSWQEWRALGVALPDYEPPIGDDEPVSLLMLDVAQNTPAYYLAHDNFRVIMRYNKSRMYAAAVTRLAEAITAKRD